MDSFVIIGLAKNSSNAGVKPWQRKLPGRLYEKYLLKTLPVEIEEIVRCKEKGKRIGLVIDEDEAIKFGKKFVADFLEGVLKKYDLENIYIEKQARVFMDYAVQDKSCLIPYMMLPKIVEQRLSENQISFKDLYPVVLDSGDKRVEFALEWLTPKLNHLMVVTKRADFFDTFREGVYEEYGLVVEVLEPGDQGIARGNFVIDTGSGLYREYRGLKKGVEVVAAHLTKEEICYIKARRADIMVVHDVEVTMEGNRINNELAAVILCGKSWNLSRFARGVKCMYYTGEIEQLNELYGISLEKIIIN